LDFLDSKNNFIDEELFSINNMIKEIPAKEDLVWEISQDDSVLTLQQNELIVQLKKPTGQLLQLTENGEMILTGNRQMGLLVDCLGGLFGK